MDRRMCIMNAGILGSDGALKQYAQILKHGCGTQVLERGQEISKRDWRVVRVAIVELRQQTYIGRLFFGDDNGVVMWDCDCRPSDGCWLALKVCVHSLQVRALEGRGLQCCLLKAHSQAGPQR